MKTMNLTKYSRMCNVNVSDNVCKSTGILPSYNLNPLNFTS